jgi:periplasmic protein TonB
MRLPEPLDARSRERDIFFNTRVEMPPLWREIYESLRERLFPLKLPQLELTSTPIPVLDRMATSTNPWAVGTATAVNGGILLLVIWVGFRVTLNQPPSASSPLGKFVIKEFSLLAPFNPRAADRGGGGGTNDPVDAHKGHNPKQAMNTLAPMQVPVLANPKLAVENSIAVPPEIKLPDNPMMAMIGVHSSANVTLVSGGSGGPTGIGSGDGGGDGPGHGQNGWGPGSHDGVYVPGRNGVTQPIPIFTQEAEFSDEARRQKYQGACTISVIVDAQGNPQNARVIQRLGMGLDEKALAAVMRYRFKPAKKDGRPVAVRISVMVNFRLY